MGSRIRAHFGAPDSFTSSMLATQTTPNTNAPMDPNMESHVSLQQQRFLMQYPQIMNSDRVIPPAPQRRPPRAPDRRHMVRNAQVRRRRHQPLNFSHQSINASSAHFHFSHSAL